MKQKAYALLRIIVSLGFIILLFWHRRNDLAKVIDIINRLHPAVLLLSSLLSILSIVVIASRLQILLYGQGLLLKFREAVYLTLIGYFFNNFLPTSVGGDVVKAYYTFKKTENKLNSFVSVFMDRFIGFVSLFLLSGFSLIFSYAYIKERYLIGISLFILALLLFIMAIFLNRPFARIFAPLAALKYAKIKEGVEKIYNAINSYKDKRGVLFLAFLISFVAQIICFSIIYFLLKDMGVFIPLRLALFLMPLISIVSMLPSINGLGIRENAIYLLFGPYVGYSNAFALSLVWLFILFLVSLIGGMAYLFGAQYRAKGLLKKGDLI